ncbi:MAG TPA: RluA family pseudouridine synthase [Pyrinomonadaceae bacterium]|nr:RluA family pseudouridine synthase [Pyrinomonadaceae bacterium]
MNLSRGRLDVCGEGDETRGPEADADALTFEVAAEDEGERLDSFLAARVEGVSRTALKRVIEGGEVLVSGRARKASYKLRAGEQIEVELPPPPPLELAPEAIPLDILHEDPDIIVVNKPAGMVVHPAAGVRGGTLANAVAHRLQIAHSPSLRPGIVHRLDRDTSGVIVVAKTVGAHEHLSEQFRAREVFKSYAALVHGVVREDAGRVEQPVGRDPRHRTRMAVVRGGRAALSLYRVRRRFERFTLLDVEIKTGRTHQIRVHLAWLKHPVVGDETYGAGRDHNLPEARLRSLVAALGRQFLHAEQLGFRHPRTGERVHFSAPLPAELSNLLDELDSGR